jgi:hypothetical protein
MLKIILISRGRGVGFSDFSAVYKLNFSEVYSASIVNLELQKMTTTIEGPLVSISPASLTQGGRTSAAADPEVLVWLRWKDV